jgi:hypothetical protein
LKEKNFTLPISPTDELYQIKDEQGTVRTLVMISESGGIYSIDQLSAPPVDAYGDSMNAGSYISRKDYIGYIGCRVEGYADASTGNQPLIHTDHRHYYPLFGIFLQRDPMLVRPPISVLECSYNFTPESLNVYRYSYNSPSIYSDVLGLTPEHECNKIYDTRSAACNSYANQEETLMQLCMYMWAGEGDRLYLLYLALRDAHNLADSNNLAGAIGVGAIGLILTIASGGSLVFIVLGAGMTLGGFGSSFVSYYHWRPDVLTQHFISEDYDLKCLVKWYGKYLSYKLAYMEAWRSHCLENAGHQLCQCRINHGLARQCDPGESPTDDWQISHNPQFGYNDIQLPCCETGDVGEPQKPSWDCTMPPLYGQVAKNRIVLITDLPDYDCPDEPYADYFVG